MGAAAVIPTFLVLGLVLGLAFGHRMMFLAACVVGSSVIAGGAIAAADEWSAGLALGAMALSLLNEVVGAALGVAGRRLWTRRSSGADGRIGSAPR